MIYFTVFHGTRNPLNEIAIVRVILGPTGVEENLSEFLTSHLRPHDPGGCAQACAEQSLFQEFDAFLKVCVGLEYEVGFAILSVKSPHLRFNYCLKVAQLYRV